MNEEWMNQLRPAISEKLEELRSAWEAAIHHEMTDAIMAGKPEVAYALPEVKVVVIQKSDTQALFEVESAGLEQESIKDDLSFYILGPSKTYVFGA